MDFDNYENFNEPIQYKQINGGCLSTISWIMLVICVIVIIINVVLMYKLTQSKNNNSENITEITNDNKTIEIKSESTVSENGSNVTSMNTAGEIVIVG